MTVRLLEMVHVPRKSLKDEPAPDIDHGTFDDETAAHQAAIDLQKAARSRGVRPFTKDWPRFRIVPA